MEEACFVKKCCRMAAWYSCYIFTCMWVNRSLPLMYL